MPLFTYDASIHISIDQSALSWWCDQYQIFTSAQLFFCPILARCEKEPLAI